MESTTMTKPMTELDVIKADIAITKADLAEAKSQLDIERRNRLEAILLEQQRERNILLAAQSKCICMI
jgi:hypothetical protein